MRLILFIVFLFLNLSVNAQYLERFWQFPDFKRTYVVEAEENSNYHYTGGGIGGNGIVILKANDKGVVKWKKTLYGSENLDDILYIDKTNELFISTVDGYYNYIIKLNPATGDSIWRRAFIINNFASDYKIKLWGENSLQCLVQYENHKAAFYSFNKNTGTTISTISNLSIDYLSRAYLQRDSDTLYYVKNMNWVFYKFDNLGIKDSIQMPANYFLLDDANKDNYLVLQDSTIPTHVPEMMLINKGNGNILKQWKVINKHDSLNGRIFSWIKTPNKGWLFSLGGATPDSMYWYHTQYDLHDGSVIWDTLFPSSNYYAGVISGKANNLYCFSNANYKPGYYKINTNNLSSVITGTKEVTESKFDIEVFPNPFKNSITISLPNNTKGTIRIFSITGILKRKIIIKEEQEIIEDITDLSCGIYLLQIQTSNYRETIRLIKE